MSEPTLEPFATRVSWSWTDPRTTAEWAALVAELLDGIAESLSSASAVPGRVIGHIKAIATFPGGGHVRGSRVSATRPADVVVGGDAPASASEALIVLNVLVYGYPHVECRDHVAAMIAGTATRVAATARTIMNTTDHNDRTMP